MKQLYLHIGTIKTGSTSIQAYLAQNAAAFRQQGFALYPGAHRADNQIELFLASMRYERDSTAKLTLQHAIEFNEEYTEAVRKRVCEYVDAVPQSKIIMTTEGLCLLRYPDEIESLKKILGAAAPYTTIIVYLRNKQDFIESYTKQILSEPGRVPSSDPASSLYLGEDAWVTDYAALVAVYERGFGKENVKVMDYDREMQLHGNVLPSFLEAVGFEAGTANYTSCFYNKS